MLPFNIKLVSIFELLKYYKKGGISCTAAGMSDSDGAILFDKFKHHIK